MERIALQHKYTFTVRSPYLCFCSSCAWSVFFNKIVWKIKKSFIAVFQNNTIFQCTFEFNLTTHPGFRWIKWVLTVSIPLKMCGNIPREFYGRSYVISFLAFPEKKTNMFLLLIESNPSQTIHHFRCTCGLHYSK